jgi:hypothetical protein
MKYLAIVPARAGSKGLLNKNFLNLKGKPLINYTLEAAKKSLKIDRLVVSTNDPKIINICKKKKIEYILRPKLISLDSSPTILAIHHVLKRLKVKEKYPFSLDDPIQKHLLSFPYPNIKIRHLLQHTSGLQEYFFWAENQTGPLDTIKNNDVLEFLANQKPILLFEPGSKFQYCNTGYILMALILEAITKEPIEDLMHHWIIQPLILNDTRIFTIESKSIFPNCASFVMSTNTGPGLPVEAI